MICDIMYVFFIREYYIRFFCYDLQDMIYDSAGFVNIDIWAYGGRKQSYHTSSFVAYERKHFG